MSNIIIDDNAKDYVSIYHRVLEDELCVRGIGELAYLSQEARNSGNPIDIENISNEELTGEVVEFANSIIELGEDGDAIKTAMQKTLELANN